MNFNDNDNIVDNWMSKWKEKERIRKNVVFYTEQIPKSLNKLDKLIKAFSKIKLNDRDLPF